MLSRRHASMRTLTLALVSASLLSLPLPGAAQGLRSFGVVVGRLDSRQLRSRSADSRTRSAVAAGVRAELATPKSWLGVGVGLTLAPRGGEHALSAPSGSEPLYGPVHADYLTFSLLPAARIELGPASLSAFVGPALDVHLRGKAAAELAPGFRDPSPQVLMAVAGLGLDVAAPGRVVLGVEVRQEEGLGNAYRNVSEGLRHRSRLISLRLGFRPSP